MLLFVLFPAPLAAQAPAPEELIEAQRAQLRDRIRVECPPASDEEEIVVCGSRGEDRHRLPLLRPRPLLPPPSLPPRQRPKRRQALAQPGA